MEGIIAAIIAALAPVLVTSLTSVTKKASTQIKNSSDGTKKLIVAIFSIITALLTALVSDIPVDYEILLVGVQTVLTYFAAQGIYLIEKKKTQELK